MFKGEYIFRHGTRKQILRVPNIITDAGEISFLKMVFQGDITDVSLGGNFYLGLCGEAAVAGDSELSDISDEPSVTNGYARKAVTRDATGWPTITEINGVHRVVTAMQTFTASGGTFSLPITRVFLCNVSSGSSGILFSFSGKLMTPITVAPGDPLEVLYSVFMDGE